MRRTIVFVAVATLVLALVPSAWAKKVEPIPTNCTAHWIQIGWDVAGKNVNDFWMEGDLLVHHGTGTQELVGDVYCRGFIYLDANWEMGPPYGPGASGSLWGDARLELSHVDGGFEVAYSGEFTWFGTQWVNDWEAHATGVGYGALTGWTIEQDWVAPTGGMHGVVEASGNVYPPR